MSEITSVATVGRGLLASPGLCRRIQLNILQRTRRITQERTLQPQIAIVLRLKNHDPEAHVLIKQPISFLLNQEGTLDFCCCCCLNGITYLSVKSQQDV